MEAFQDRRVALAVLAGVVAGILVGWLVIGWNLYPVKWVNADPEDLREEHRAAYVAMVADSYTLNEDLALAEKRLKGFKEEEVSQILGSLSAGGRGIDRERVAKLAKDLSIAPEARPTETPAAAPVKPAPSRLVRILRIFGIVLLAFLVLVLGAALAARYGLLPRRAREEAHPETQGFALRERLDFTERAREPPPGEFVTTYSLGDDGYDASFTIESPSGEFLGECGVGIAETVGQAPPEKVTAFEAWLFDKSDVRTVTKVLFSEYAYHDDALRSRLAAKGEPILAEPGKSVVLETDLLRIEARVAEMTYGDAGDLPSRSLFSRFTVELVPSVRRRSFAV